MKKCHRCQQLDSCSYLIEDRPVCLKCMTEWLDLLKKVIDRFLNNQPILFQETIIEDD